MPETPRFNGYTNVTLDAKGRIVVPSKWRAQLGGNIVFQAAALECLYIYPRAVWDETYARMKTASGDDDFEQQRLEQFMRFSELDNPVDNGGRVLVPQNLRDDMDFAGELTLAGSDDKLELWRPADFKEFTRRERERFLQHRTRL